MPLALGVKDIQWRLNFKGSSRASAEPGVLRLGKDEVHADVDSGLSALVSQ